MRQSVAGDVVLHAAVVVVGVHCNRRSTLWCVAYVYKDVSVMARCRVCRCWGVAYTAVANASMRHSSWSSGADAFCSAISSLYTDDAHTLGSQWVIAMSRMLSVRKYASVSVHKNEKPTLHGAEHDGQLATALTEHTVRHVYGCVDGGSVHKQCAAVGHVAASDVSQHVVSVAHEVIDKANTCKKDTKAGWLPSKASKRLRHVF